MQPSIVITQTCLISALGHDHHQGLETLYRGQQDWTEVDCDGRVVMAGLVTDDLKSKLAGQGWRSARKESLMLGLASQELAKDRTFPMTSEDLGLVVGCKILSYPHENMEAIYRHQLSMVNPLTFTNQPSNAPASHTAIRHGLQGMSLTLSSGNTAGLEALFFASQAIITGRSRLMLAGAVESQSLEEIAILTNYYNKDARGLSLFGHHEPGQVVAGDGCGLVQLLTRQEAQVSGMPLLAEIKGFGMASQYGSSGPQAGIRAMTQALAMAACRPEDIDAVLLAANGHCRQDEMENEALKAVFPQPLPAVALKGAWGETGHAFGTMAAVVAVEAMRRNQLPPTVNLRHPELYSHARLEPAMQQLPLRKVMILTLDEDQKAAALVLGRLS